MDTLLRPRILVPIVVVVALVAGFLALKSLGDDDKAKLQTTNSSQNCPPVARSDAAATKPSEPIAIDVLANDTDADGDPLVFQILKTDGGTSAIDDGDTPTDASDDRLLFTPATPAPESATVEYEALDPQGGFASSTVTVAINETATLPDGVRSAFATETPAGSSQSSKCQDTVPGTTTPETLFAAGVTTTTEFLITTNTTTRSGNRTTTTVKKSAKKTTTTTAKKSTTTTSGGGSNTTDPPQTTPTTKPTTTTKPPPTTTTTTPGQTTTTRPICHQPNTRPDQDPVGWDAFRDCIENGGRPG